MNMIPVISLKGKLLGHVNLNECDNLKTHVVVSDRQRPKAVMPQNGVVETDLHQITLPVMQIVFQQHGQQSAFVYLQAIELPDWFWASYAACNFIPASEE